MDLYRRIAAIRNEEEADDLTDELIDRYGDPPRTVNNLIAVALLRAAAAETGISEIAQKGSSLHFVLQGFDLQRVSVLCAREKYGAGCSSPRGRSPIWPCGSKKGRDALKLGRILVEDYRATAPEN